MHVMPILGDADRLVMLNPLAAAQPLEDVLLLLVALRGNDHVDRFADDLFWPVAEQRDHSPGRSEEHTSELQSQSNLVCRLLLEKKKYKPDIASHLLSCSA